MRKDSIKIPHVYLLQGNKYKNMKRVNIFNLIIFGYNYEILKIYSHLKLFQLCIDILTIRYKNLRSIILI